MSTRTTFRPQQVITNGDMSQATITSKPTILQSLNEACYTFSWTGSSPVGSIALQISNNYALDSGGGVANAGTWNTVTIDVAGTPAQSVTISGNTGNDTIDPIKTGAYAVRLLYTKVSGTGSLQCYINAKVGS